MVKILILVVLCAVLGARGHGSHSHMRTGKTEHQHYVPRQPKDSQHGVQSILRETELIHDTEHIREDLRETMSEKDISKMSPQELEFHYFKLHDYDNNNKLDGTEMLSAIIHVLPADPDLDLKPIEGHRDPVREQKYQQAVERRAQSMGYYTRMIDKMLEDNDTDKDGYINYAEFVISRKAA